MPHTLMSHREPCPGRGGGGRGGGGGGRRGHCGAAPLALPARGQERPAQARRGGCPCPAALAPSPGPRLPSRSSGPALLDVAGGRGGLLGRAAACSPSGRRPPASGRCPQEEGGLWGVQDSRPGWPPYHRWRCDPSRRGRRPSQKVGMGSAWTMSSTGMKGCQAAIPAAAVSWGMHPAPKGWHPLSRPQGRWR